MVIRNLGLPLTAVLLILNISAQSVLGQNQPLELNSVAPKTSGENPQIPNQANGLGPELEINTEAIANPKSSPARNLVKVDRNELSPPPAAASRSESFFKPQQNRGIGIIRVDTP